MKGSRKRGTSGELSQQRKVGVKVNLAEILSLATLRLFGPLFHCEAPFSARSCSSATPQRSFLAKTLDVFGGGLGRHLRLALDHDADSLDYLGVGKRSDVANVHGIRDGA
jgi:hypothetical protein